MRPSTHRAALLIGAALLFCAADSLPAAPPCQITMQPAAVRLNGLSYLAHFTVAPTCPAAAVFRVRKTSRLTQKALGHPVQPAIPDGSLRYGGVWSWPVTRTRNGVPLEDRWSLTSWVWEASYQGSPFHPIPRRDP